MGPAADTLAIVALFAAAGLLMRSFAERREKVGEEGKVEPPGIAVTADGERLLEGAEDVRILPPGDLETIWPVRGRSGLDWNLLMFQRSTPVDPRSHAPVSSWIPGTRLVPGDLVGVRLRPRADGAEPAWILEALGRDRDYRAWGFDRVEEAHAALGMLERRVVRRLAFDRGPWPPGPADYERALRERLETEREVTGGPGGWTWSVAGGGDWLGR